MRRFLLALAVVVAVLAGAVPSSLASSSAGQSTPLEPRPGEVVQGANVTFQLALPQDAEVSWTVLIYAGPPSMRPVLPADPGKNDSAFDVKFPGASGTCQAEQGFGAPAACTVDGLRPGPKVWYAAWNELAIDSDGNVSQHLKIDGPYPFSIASVPPICLLSQRHGRVTATPRVAKGGDLVTVRGSGFVPGYPVKIWPEEGAGGGHDPYPQDTGPTPPKQWFFAIPKTPIPVTGGAYSVQTRTVTAQGRFQTSFRLPKNRLLDPSWAGQYVLFMAAQPRNSCSRIPGYALDLLPLYAYATTFFNRTGP